MKNFKLSWANLFGHAATVNLLKKNIADGTFPHAVIFSGIEGLGKRLAAEICAAALLCENPVGGEPCGTCENCHQVAAKSHPDFLVVEPEDSKTTRNIKIGQIREMQAQASLSPINSSRRVVILDGADFMNAAAANSMLKTLEEPTSQTIFILLTANRSSLLMTIRSRCRTINFAKLSAAEIRDELIRREIDEATAQSLSIIANGSFGRALALKDSDSAQVRELALTTLEKICREEFTSEDIFKLGEDVDKWPREKFSDFLTHVQKILRDAWTIEISDPINSDLSERVRGLKISDRKIFSLIETGAQFHKRLKSNANLRLLAEAYLFRLREILR